MPRSRMFAIYGLVAMVALGSGLLIAQFFGTSATLPSGYATPDSAASQPPTAPSAGQAVAATPNAAPSPTLDDATSAPATAALPTEPPPTEAPAPTAVLPTTPPTEAPTPTAEAAYVEYTVQRRDSLKSIAAKYGVTIRDIIAANQIPNPDSLTVGMVLRIPKK